MNDLKLMSFEIQIRWTCNNVFKLFTRMSKKIILYIINYNYTVIEANVIIFICKKKKKKEIYTVFNKINDVIQKFNFRLIISK